MCNDVASNGFLGISSKHGGPVHLGYHLVGDHNTNTKLGEEQQDGKCEKTDQYIDPGYSQH